MIRVVIEVRGDKLNTEVSTEGMEGREVGIFLLGVQQVKKKIMKEWEENGTGVGEV